MILRRLLYPVADSDGRVATLRTIAALLAFALGVRYTGVLVPSALALVTIAVTGVALTVLFGTLAQVLADPSRIEAFSIRSSFVPGLRALALATVALAPPLLLLASMVGDVSGEPPTSEATGVVLLFGSTATLLFFFACLYVFPALLAIATTRGSVRRAADRELLVPVLSDLSYLSRWTLGLVLLIPAMSLVTTSLQSGEVAGVLAAGGAALLWVAGARVVGDGYDMALGTRTVE
ncbi:hypothetical protein [Natranaeroarchaeum aerophilus]|uniref:DUF4013 domain-containing protein n=1 Tax=Natranaeroarchaeum aerophilus TaxID=2917711 RepID=A0AAE3K5C9_9EURY|nr:hypothetical protein [Natranaeroarchaeum aerophilus]MCL9813866.1 hypothetical protein [Natranaeroarchaeum aerophilus]